MAKVVGTKERRADQSCLSCLGTPNILDEPCPTCQEAKLRDGIAEGRLSDELMRALIARSDDGDPSALYGNPYTTHANPQPISYTTHANPTTTKCASCGAPISFACLNEYHAECCPMPYRRICALCQSPRDAKFAEGSGNYREAPRVLAPATPEPEGPPRAFLGVLLGAAATLVGSAIVFILWQWLVLGHQL